MKSSRQLIQDAKDYRFNPIIPLKIYLKTCVGILDKAQMSVQCGDSEMAFMFYYRYVDLCTNKLARHPQCLSKANKDPEIQLYKQEYLQLIKLEVPAVLKLIEDLQKQIDRQYNKHQLSLAKNIAKPTNSVLNHHLDKINNNMETSSQDDTIKYPFLPNTFNEHRFNQSLAYFNTNLTHNNNNNNNNNTNTTTTNNQNNNNSPNTYSRGNNNTKQENNPNNETPIFHYPELPHLSFPTF
ncbi:regulator of free ubiquitin chains 1 [Monosporozyma servazzii]